LNWRKKNPAYAPLSAHPQPSSELSFGAHSTISAAGASVLSAFFGEDGRIDVTSDALPGTM
jgi:hypothetical protein